MPRVQWPRIVDRAANIVTSYNDVGGCTHRQVIQHSEALITWATITLMTR
ncbi:hypothetical protein QIS99_31205 [Streptomyces sp. B-S-A8]|uniref:Transposase n=1 Tax=Streptomyces solicavernae TaxID=3043614 RepID=A0ABT6S220_9ACTN|nr:hypothetical protein [Streptomyces sp. B-S-A8]MDI3390630.1 hypothetical protein [Streptomyces sp. B-S-A8]